MLNFSVSEYKSRHIKTKERMLQSVIDVMLVTDPENMNYLTGYDAWSFYVHQLVIVMKNEDETVWVCRGMDETSAEYTKWIKKENIIAYSDDYVQSTEKHPMDFVADIVKKKGYGTK